MIGNHAQTARFMRFRCHGRRYEHRVDSSGRDPDDSRRGRTEQRHRDDERQERARDAEPPELNREDVAADGENQQQQDDLDRSPIPRLAGGKDHHPGENQEQQVDA